MKTIICGIDGSPGARAALRVAVELARRLSARLVAVHVGDQPGAEGDTAQRVATDIVAEEILDYHAEARGATGDVVERLASIARSEQALMIVVGARRRGRSRAFLRARSAVGLVGLTDIPVLVAPLSTGMAEARRATPATNDGSAGLDTTTVDAAPRLSPEAAAEDDRGSDRMSVGRVRPAGSTVAEQRRLRRNSRLPRRPAWFRGSLPSRRS